MYRRQAISAIGLAAVTGLQAQSSARDRFPGIYKLVTYKTTAANGEVTDNLGPDPIGRITYHKNGMMSVMLMRRERTVPQRLDMTSATPDQLREALRLAQANNAGFIAYMGTYTVEEAKSNVIHHLLGGSGANFAGQDFVRRYELTPTAVILSVPPQLNSRLVWERVGDA
jgi:hypothetical protein